MEAGPLGTRREVADGVSDHRSKQPFIPHTIELADLSGNDVKATFCLVDYHGESRCQMQCTARWQLT